MENKFINNTSFSEMNDRDFLYFFNRFKDGDYNSLDILVKGNMKLIYWYIDSYIVCNRDEYDDIFSVSCEAMVECFYKYDLDKGVKFSTFLITCIRNKILKYFRSEKKYKDIISLDEDMYDDSDITFKDTIIDDSYSLEEDIIDKDLLDYRKKIVMLEFNNLCDIDREIISLYFGFIDDKVYSQSEISKIIGISQSQVSKRLSRVLKQIRDRFNFIENDENIDYKIMKRVA